MPFIQIIEFRTDKIDEVRNLDEAWRQRAKAEGSLARRGILCADRDNTGRYFEIVFFDSFEEAEKNSTLSVTQEFAGEMMALGNGEPTFHNLDVVDDVDYR
jgi:hypothetical protein